MKVVVIEDEPLVAKEMVSMIRKTDPAIEILAVLDSVKNAVDWLSKNPQPELIFSDIQLSDGNSFDVFAQVKYTAPIVFTTAYSEYTLRAFKLNSIDYLLKPIEPDELKKTIEKFKRIRGYSAVPAYDEMFRQMLQDYSQKDQKKYKQRFLAHLGSSLIPVESSEISLFSYDNVVFLHTRDNRQLVTDYHSLDELEELLEPKTFYRANRQHIVHVDAVESIKLHHTGKLQVFLKKPLNMEISVSREKAKSFRLWFEKE